MSQRRMTLAALDTNKAPMAPGSLKGSDGKPVQPASGVRGRASLAVRPSLNDVRPRASLLPGQGRRSVGMGRMSLVPGLAGAQPLKDTRLRSKNARAHMETSLLQFLESTHFTMAGWSPKLVHEPTQLAFVSMFKHTYAHCVDDGYIFGADGRKFEEEVLLLLKEIRYPFVDDLTKTKLTAAGSQQNWPVCLAMLDWIVQLGRALAPASSGPLARHDDNELHALFFPYLWRCYERFWDNQDTYPEEQQALAASFEAKNAALAETVQALAADKAALDEQLHALTDKPSPLEREQHERRVLQGDLAKFVQYHNDVLVPKLDKSRRTMERLEAALHEHTAELQTKQAERARRQQLIDAQAVSMDEFERRLAEREWLARQLDELAAQTKAAVERCWRVELALSKQQASVEARLRTFDLSAQRARLFPLALPDGVELTELALVPANPTTMLAPGVSMHAVRHKIEALRAAALADGHARTDERVAVQGRVDEQREALERLRRDGRRGETRLETLRAQMDEMHALASREEDESSAERVRQEEMVRTMDHTSALALQQAEARRQALHLQYVRTTHPRWQEALESTAAERAAMHDDMCAALHTLLDLKMRVAEGLDAIGQAVQAAVRG